MTYFVGSITGTSIDGLDLALVDISTSISIRAAQTAPFPEALQDSLKSLTQPGLNEIERLGIADRELGSFIGEQILLFLRELGIPTETIRAIGSHGQTIRHSPNGDVPFTLQIGDASCIAEVTGIDTIADFRSRDMAANGQGAPLVPIFHEALFRSDSANRTVLNIGGISNITVLPKDPILPVTGFDTGPGNTLLDAVAQRYLNKPFDENGELSRNGYVIGVWLRHLLADPFYQKQPPKSTGKEHFNIRYLDEQRSGFADLSIEDIQATLCELTALSIAESIERWGQPTEEVFVCGGGRLNSDLLTRLRTHLPTTDVLVSDQLGIDGDAIEAATFAYLGYRFLENFTGNLPTVTGAIGTRRLGCLYKA